MRRLLIVGAGGFGRELFHWVQQHPDHGSKWSLGGFLDDRPDALKGFSREPGIVETIADYRPSPRDILICGLGLPKSKKTVVDSLVERGAEFLTFIHPAATLGGHIEIGVGSVVCPGAILTSDIRLGKFVTINNCATIGHDVVVGDYASLSCHADVTGFCRVGEGVFFGSHAGMIPSTSIGDWAIVGAGSMVIIDVSSGTTVLGVPAKRLSL
jgi:sugar O-acyltransferase (sialic acid O-acetyltransferase NeuD family)